MQEVTRDMGGPRDMPVDMFVADMSSPEDMTADLGIDMPAPMSCERVADCETGQANVIASCSGTGLCSYQCTNEDWAVTDGESISTEGCTCTVNEEICDNRDNDCDTQIDEDLMKLCANQEGVCEGSSRVCRGVASDFAKECEVTDYIENSTNYTNNSFESFACDGLDNDCDGYTDESCCDSLPLLGIDVKISTEGFATHGVVATINTDPRNPERQFLFTYGLIGDGNSFFTQKANLDNMSLVVSPENSSQINNSTPCIRARSLEFAMLDDADQSMHTIDSCERDGSHKIILTSIPTVNLGEESNIQNIELDWNQIDVQDPEADQEILFNIASNNQSILATAWDYQQGDYKLQWCLSNNPSLHCQGTDQALNITTTNPNKPFPSVSEAGKGLIAITNPDNDSLGDIERIIELASSGSHVKNHDVRLPSVHGGSRLVIDHEATWLNEEDILIAHLVRHETANKNTLYLAKHSTATNTTTNNSIDFPSTNNPRELEIIVSNDNISILTIGTAGIFSHSINDQLVLNNETHIISPPEAVGKLRHHKRDEKILISFLKDTRETATNVSYHYILSKEGIPLCEFESGTPEMTMP
jgi:hypothetical protein